MSTSMSDHLSSLYRAPAQAQGQEDLMKTAATELFLKLAEEQNIDITKFAPEEVSQMFSEFSAKLAADAAKKEGDEEDDEQKEKEKKAAAYHQERVELAEKTAEAKLMGQIMARSLVSELGVIEQEKIAAAKQAGEMPPAFAAAAAAKKDKGDKDEDKDDKKSEKEKQAAAFEEQAVACAVKIAASTGRYGEKELAQIQKHAEAISTLNLLEESVKIASSRTWQEAVTIRGYEYLEKLGFEIDWSKVVGS